MIKRRNSFFTNFGWRSLVAKAINGTNNINDLLKYIYIFLQLTQGHIWLLHGSNKGLHLLFTDDNCSSSYSIGPTQRVDDTN